MNSVKELHTASTHPMQYYVSLPPGWSKARTWPVVVTVASSGKEWVENNNAFAAERDARRYPFIIVTPIVLTNGGRDLRRKPSYNYAPSVWDRVDREGRCAFDLDGLRAVLSDVARVYGGQTKAFLTGWSGGGPIVIASLLLQPETLRGAAPAAANYGGRCVTAPTEGPGDVFTPRPISNTASRATLPVRFFNGGSDPHSNGLLTQKDLAINFAQAHGFENVSAVVVPNVGHDPMVSPVLDYFFSLLAPNER